MQMPRATIAHQIGASRFSATARTIAAIESVAPPSMKGSAYIGPASGDTRTMNRPAMESVRLHDEAGGADWRRFAWQCLQTIASSVRALRQMGQSFIVFMIEERAESSLV